MKIDELALAIAQRAHEGTFRADGRTPYIAHPMVVAAVVRAAGGGETAVAAALLHDVIEDTDMKPSELIELAGGDVADLVIELTFPNNMPDRRRRMVERVPSMSQDAKLIKLADIYCNLSDIPRAGWDPDRARRYYRHLLAMRVALAGTHAVLEKAFDDTAERFPVA